MIWHKTWLVVTLGGVRTMWRLDWRQTYVMALIAGSSQSSMTPLVTRFIVTTCHERWHLVMALVMLWASPSLVSCECSLVPRSWAQKSLSGTGSQGTSQVLFRIFLGSQDTWVSPSQVCTRACCWSCWCTPPPSSQACLRHTTPTWRWCSQQVPTCCSQLHLPNRTLLSTHYLHPSSPDGGHM